MLLLSTSLQANIAQVRKIWDGAPHNAFTDLVRYRNAWWCVFREGSSHVPGTNGTIRVLHSSNGNEWTSAALISENGIDLRDPKISITPDGRMMLILGGSFYSGEEGAKDRKILTGRARVTFSFDGRTWTKPLPVGVPAQEWLWRVTWHKGTGYGISYSLGKPMKDIKITLWQTRDGINYETVSKPEPPCWPNETTLRFLPDDTLLAFVRGEQSDRHNFLGRSQPPYRQWQWTDTGRAAHGPNFLVLPDGRLAYAGRDYQDGARTVVGLIRNDKCEPLLTLPSGGDTSYPGLVWHEEKLWVSYYASHEGKTSIYLAQVSLPPLTEK